MEMYINCIVTNCQCIYQCVSPVFPSLSGSGAKMECFFCHLTYIRAKLLCKGIYFL